MKKEVSQPKNNKKVTSFKDYFFSDIEEWKEIIIELDNNSDLSSIFNN